MQVSRSLHACQGVVLVVDASQGVQAQTVANYHAATSSGVSVLPVVNKIDLPHADVERVRSQLHTLYGIDPSIVIPVSAKSGLGVSKVLDSIIRLLPPPPPPTPGAPFKALLFDMWYDDYKVIFPLARARSSSVVTCVDRGLYALLLCAMVR
jgi:GTP-binding protein LepA